MHSEIVWYTTYPGHVVSTFLDAVIFYVGQVDIDWKKQIFAGQKDQSKKISGLQVGGTR